MQRGRRQLAQMVHQTLPILVILVAAYVRARRTRHIHAILDDEILFFVLMLHHVDRLGLRLRLRVVNRLLRQRFVDERQVLRNRCRG